MVHSALIILTKDPGGLKLDQGCHCSAHVRFTDCLQMVQSTAVTDSNSLTILPIPVHVQGVFV